MLYPVIVGATEGPEIVPVSLNPIPTVRVIGLAEQLNWPAVPTMATFFNV